MRDEVYRQSQDQIVDFAFSDAVAAVFPDMIRRSVPGYETLIPLTGLMVARHLGDQGLAYDLGCSLGATTAAILSQAEDSAIQIIGVDNAPAMIERAQTHITDPRVEFRLADLTNVAVNGANAITLNFVMQFLEPELRGELVKRWWTEMAPGGLLIFSEKVKNPHPAQHQWYDETHLAWKRANGYSELEVSQKRSALEAVMRVDTEATHVERLQAAGFVDIYPWYRCMNWASFAARKP